MHNAHAEPGKVTSIYHSKLTQTAVSITVFYYILLWPFIFSHDHVEQKYTIYQVLINWKSKLVLPLLKQHSIQ